MDAWPVLIVVAVAVVIALIVVAAVVSARRERERREALRRWAARHGWTYDERPVAPDWTSRLPGRNRRGVSLMLSGVVDGHPVDIAEYSYTHTTTSTTRNADGTSSTSTSSTTYHYVAVVVRLPRPGPSIEVQPRHALSKLGRALFGDRATAVGHDPFDRAFSVGAKDPTVVRQLLGPALIDEHLAGRVPGWSLDGADLLTYQNGRLDGSERVADRAAPLVRVATLLGR
jgi:hypothetical protein